MPAAVGAIAAGALSYGAGTTLFGLTVLQTALLTTVGSFALSTLQSKLGAKQSKGNAGAAGAGQTQTQQFKQAITTRKIIYGEARVSGPLVFASSTDGNKYLHLVIALASHEVEEIGEVWLDDTSIPPDYIDGNGDVTTGRYAGYVRIKKHLGADDQTADSDMVSDLSEWTSNHRLRGIAYVYLRYKYDRDIFPTGIPNFSAWVKGKAVLDTRTAGTVWTPNIALQAHDFMLWEKFGIGAAAAAIDSDYTDSAANTCEEIVATQNLDTEVSSIDLSTDIITLAGDRLELQTGDRAEVTTTGTAPAGLAVSTNYYVIVYQRKGTPRIQLATSLDNALAGTAINITDAGTGTHTIRKNGEPRYFGGGVLDTAAPVGDNLRDVLSGMGGSAVYTGGMWQLLAAVYRSPSVTFNEDHLRGPVRMVTRVSRRDRFNTVKGVYISPLNDGQPADYPAVTNSTYKTSDGSIEIIDDLDLPFTSRPHTGMRLAKIKLEKHRRETVLEYPANLHALKVKVGDVVYVTNDRLGLSADTFEVMSWKFVVEEDENQVPILGIDLVLKATDSAVYSWNSSEETAVPVATASTKLNPFDVDPPTSLAVTPVEIGTQQNDKTYRFDLSWSPPANEFVVNGGRYEIQFKKTAESTYQPSFFVDGDQTMAPILQVQPGVNYDVRIRSVNTLNARSAWTALTGFTVESPSGATIQIDYGSFTADVVDSIDFGSFADSVDDELDFGEFV